MVNTWNMQATIKITLAGLLIVIGCFIVVVDVSADEQVPDEMVTIANDHIISVVGYDHFEKYFKYNDDGTRFYEIPAFISDEGVAGTEYIVKYEYKVFSQLSDDDEYISVKIFQETAGKILSKKIFIGPSVFAESIDESMRCVSRDQPCIFSITKKSAIQMAAEEGLDVDSDEFFINLVYSEESSRFVWEAHSVVLDGESYVRCRILEIDIIDGSIYEPEHPLCLGQCDGCDGGVINIWQWLLTAMLLVGVVVSIVGVIIKMVGRNQLRKFDTDTQKDLNDPKFSSERMSLLRRSKASTVIIIIGGAVTLLAAFIWMVIIYIIVR